jgi:hypothetical protein
VIAAPSLAAVDNGVATRPIQGWAGPGQLEPTCPADAAMTLTLNGVCVGTPTEVLVAKAQPTQTGGGAWTQSPNPKLIVVVFGAPLSSTLANWAAAGGPAGTIVITTWGPGHVAERTTTLDGATPAGVTAGPKPQLTLRYTN